MDNILRELDNLDGTSSGMVTLVIPAESKAQQYISRLEYEITTASNIKSRV